MRTEVWDAKIITFNEIFRSTIVSVCCTQGNLILFSLRASRRSAMRLFQIHFLSFAMNISKKKKFNLTVSLKEFQFTIHFLLSLLLLLCYINKADDKIYLFSWHLQFFLVFGLVRMTVVFSQERRVYLSACNSGAFFILAFSELRRKKTNHILRIPYVKQFLVDRGKTFHLSWSNETLKNQLCWKILFMLHFFLAVHFHALGN